MFEGSSSGNRERTHLTARIYSRMPAGPQVDAVCGKGMRKIACWGLQKCLGQETSHAKQL